MFLWTAPRLLHLLPRLHRHLLPQPPRQWLMFLWTAPRLLHLLPQLRRLQPQRLQWLTVRPQQRHR
jgi:hypothetical protein